MRRIAAVLLALAATGSAVAGPKEAVHDAFGKLLAAKSFRATVTDVTKNEPVSSMEFVAPDRYRVQSKQGPVTIIIGDDGWMDVGGKPMKVPMPVGKIIAQFRNQQMAQQLEAGMVVTDAGSESVDGEPAHVYTYKVTEPMTADVRLWVSDKTGLPVQIESKGSFMGRPGQTRIRYRDFNDTTIAIAVPQG